MTRRGVAVAVAATLAAAAAAVCAALACLAEDEGLFETIAGFGEGEAGDMPAREATSETRRTL